MRRQALESNKAKGLDGLADVEKGYSEVVKRGKYTHILESWNSLPLDRSSQAATNNGAAICWLPGQDSKPPRSSGSSRLWIFLHHVPSNCRERVDGAETKSPGSPGPRCKARCTCGDRQTQEVLAMFRKAEMCIDHITQAPQPEIFDSSMEPLAEKTVGLGIVTRCVARHF